MTKIQKLYFAILAARGMTNERKPIEKIFIGGAPRSGTTMLASIMGSHSKILVTSETQFKFDLAHLFTEKSVPAEDIFHQLTKNKRFRIWDPDVNKEDMDYSGLSNFMESLVKNYSIKTDRKEYTHWVDVTPVNLRHASFLNRQFPECLFIHLVRDGRGVYASQQKVDFGSNDPVFAALKWTEAVALGLSTEIAFAKRCLRVHYENLLRNPELECIRICEFTGIEFEPAMIEATGFKKSAYSSETHQLVGKRPDPVRIDKWKQDLSEKDILYFESMTYDLLDMLGYERINKGILKKPDEFTQTRIMFLGALKYLTIDKWKNRARYKKNIK